MRYYYYIIMGWISCFFAACSSSDVQVKEWKQSTPSQEWTDVNLTTIQHEQADLQIVLDSLSNQELTDGMGITINRKAIQLLNVLDKQVQKEIRGVLFNSDQMNLTDNYMLIDEALQEGGTSYNDTPNDFEMLNINICKDEPMVLPFLKQMKEMNQQIKIKLVTQNYPLWIAEKIKDKPYQKAYQLYKEKIVDTYSAHGLSVASIDSWHTYQSSVGMSQQYSLADTVGVETASDSLRPLILINDTTRTYQFTKSALRLKHFSRFVKPGARLWVIKGNYPQVWACKNTDGQTVVVIDGTNRNQQLSIIYKGQCITFAVAPYSMNTLVLE